MFALKAFRYTNMYVIFIETLKITKKMYLKKRKIFLKTLTITEYEIIEIEDQLYVYLSY